MEESGATKIRSRTRCIQTTDGLTALLEFAHSALVLGGVSESRKKCIDSKKREGGIPPSSPAETQDTHARRDSGY